MKRNYIVPQLDVVKFELGGIIATSIQASRERTDEVESKRQDFSGGLWSNMIDDDKKAGK